MIKHLLLLHNPIIYLPHKPNPKPKSYINSYTMSQANLGSKRRMRRKEVPSPDSWICKPRRDFNPNLEFESSNVSHRHRYEQLTQGTTKKQVVNSLAPHTPTMVSLGIFDEVNEIFVRSGLKDWIELMSFPTHKSLVLEFYSTFEPLMEKGVCQGWTYSMNNMEFIVRKEEIRSSLWLPKEGKGYIPLCSEEQRVFMWRELTDMEEYDRNCSPKCIKGGVWKYIHRLIATNINTRGDEGSRVSRDDLDLMFWMSQRQKIDWFYVFTERFTRMSTIKDKSKGLGCATIITRLARNERFDFETVGEYKELDIPRLVTMRIIDAKRHNWISNQEMPKTASRKGKEKMEGSSWEWEEQD